MSLQAMTWAMDQAPVTDKAARLVLIYMADVSDKQGRHSYQSVGTLCKRSRYSEATVRRAIGKLRSSGLIREGDQSRAGHLPNGQRPVVYDLCMSLTWEDPMDGTPSDMTGVGVVPGDGPEVTDPSHVDTPSGLRPLSETDWNPPQV